MAITFTSVAANIAWVGAMLVAFGLIFESLTGVPLEFDIIGGAFVICLYTMIGGMWAVALTDFLQMIIIIVGLVILLAVVLIDVGGWASNRFSSGFARRNRNDNGVSLNLSDGLLCQRNLHRRCSLLMKMATFYRLVLTMTAGREPRFMKSG